MRVLHLSLSGSYSLLLFVKVVILTTSILINFNSPLFLICICVFVWLQRSLLLFVKVTTIPTTSILVTTVQPISPLFFVFIRFSLSGMFDWICGWISRKGRAGQKWSHYTRS